MRLEGLELFHVFRSTKLDKNQTTPSKQKLAYSLRFYQNARKKRIRASVKCLKVEELDHLT